MNTWKHTFLFFNTKKRYNVWDNYPIFFHHNGYMWFAFIMRKCLTLLLENIIITLFSLWWWHLSKSLSYQICYVKLIRTKFSKIIMTKVSKLMTKFTNTNETLYMHSSKQHLHTTPLFHLQLLTFYIAWCRFPIHFFWILVW